MTSAISISSISSISSVRFLISSNPASLSAALAAFEKTATVEAEYGDVLVEGTCLTLAHHGARSANPAPCLRGNDVVEGLEAVGLSHLDLDAIGGVMSILGCKPGCDSFWALAAFVDLNGPHKITSDANVSDIEALHAFWAWSEAHRTFAPRDGSVLDITSQVWEAIDAVTRILTGDPTLLEQGRVWAAKAAALEESSFRSSNGKVILRVSEGFVNHLYAHKGVVSQGVVAFNPEKGTVTLSLESSLPEISCAVIARELWGNTAGGHAGIAGSPREGGLGYEEAGRAFHALSEVLERYFLACEELADEANHICGIE